MIDTYIEIFRGGFALFQVLFWDFINILPYFVIIVLIILGIKLLFKNQ